MIAGGPLPVLRLLDHFGILMDRFWVRKGLEMIPSHIAFTELNKVMSRFRTIWTHFRQTSMISGSPERLTGVLKAVFFLGKKPLGFMVVLNV